MCAGDTTLEKAIVVNGGTVIKGVNGRGIARQCRDWKSIYDYTVEHS